MGATADIFEALCSGVEDAFPNLDIAWENVEYDPKDGDTFVEVVIKKTFNKQGMGQEAFVEHTGLLYFLINVPTGTAGVAARELADAANSVYSRGATFSSGEVEVRIEGFDTGQLVPSQKAWAQLPCIVRWRCHVPPPEPPQ